jgi:heptose-I-phosphate ethanolaminephosphotransferase
VTLSLNVSGQPARPFGALVAGLLVVLAFVQAGHDARRTVQLMVLAFPVLAALLWRASTVRQRRLQRGAVWLATMPFLADSIVRAYLFNLYEAAPDSATVLGAMANSSAGEALEYIDTHWRDMAVAAGTLVAGGVALAFAVQLDAFAAVPGRWRYRRVGHGALMLVALLCAFALINKPWRKLHPLVFWPAWTNSVVAQQAAWAHHEAARRTALDDARLARPVTMASGPATVVLVVSESINRDNLGLYGYARDTTPLLAQQQARLGANFLTMRNAWSTEASTIPALRALFGVAGAGSRPELHMLALARAAGYKVWWISNQEDMAIENVHARLADVVQMQSHTPGRSAKSLDEQVLQPMQAALADRAERKLIVLHLMGAHPHYRFRYPPGAAQFSRRADSVDRGLIAQDKPRWVRRLRDDYDSALVYQDRIVSHSLDLARASAPASGYLAWMYLSDHGQEVGHTSNRIGHSPGTAAGYRIPALIWQRAPRPGMVAGAGARPFRSDWADMTLAHLLGMQWQGYRASQNVLDPRYSWVVPVLPAKIAAFDR